MEGDRIQWIQGGFLSRPVFLMGVHPVVALNSALGFIKPLTIKAQPLNQCDQLDQPNSDL